MLPSGVFSVAHCIYSAWDNVCDIVTFQTLNHAESRILK